MSKQSKAKKQNPVTKRPPVKPAGKMTPQAWYAIIIIAAMTFIAYLPSLSNGFVNLDDDRYVFENNKLFLQSVAQMFSIPGGYHMGNYHPFAMVGYKIIYGFAKYNPYTYHLVNLIIHILNTILAFLFIRKLTGKLEVAFIAGLFFGVHTMHVESVAWISELKDLLYAFFFFLTLLWYLRYLDDTSNKKFYILAVILFLCSLLSKAMGASLTIVLLLIDFYKGRKFNAAVIVEKIPFFVLSVVFGVIAIYAQKSLDAIQDIALFKFYERVIFACYGYITYIWKLALPMNLSAYYAYPTRTGNTLPAVYFAYPVLVIGVVAATLFSLKKTRKVFFGVGFFSVTVFLVLQLLPVGGAVMADRYSYIPSLGIFYLFAEGIYYLYSQKQYKSIAYGLVLIGGIGYSVSTYNRCHIWKDGMTMWSDVIDKTRLVALAFNNRGVLYNKQGQALNDSIKKHNLPSLQPQKEAAFNKAITDFRSALSLNSQDQEALNNLGLAYWRLNRLDSAEHYLKTVLAINPKYAIGWSNLGSVLYSMNRADESLNAYETSVKCDPGFSDGWYNIGIIKYNLGRKDEACAALREAARLGMAHAADAVRDLCK